MSRAYAHHHHISNKPPIVVNDNDVLSGRGVNIAHHPGNERFRTLVTTRADETYCTTYSASEKRAVAEEIIKHIHCLDPPGRFLKRDGRGQVSRGLNGPWEELTERECIKKTCQALRDCNRTDRAGYAIGVVPPEDVVKTAEELAKSGLTGKQHAAQAAAASAAAAAAAASATLKRNRDTLALGMVGVPGAPPVSSHPGATANGADGGRVSPSVENAAEWLKKQRTTDGLPNPTFDAGTQAAQAAAAAAAAAVVGGDGLLAPPPLPPHPNPSSSAPAANVSPAPVGNGIPQPTYQPDPQAAAAAAQYPIPNDILSPPSAVPPPAPVPGPAPVAPPYNPMENLNPEDVNPGPLNITEL